MTSQGSVKKSRAIRTTTTQYEELVKYMENHSEFAAGKFLTKEGKIHHAQQWEELRKMLNALSNGPGKTVKQWQTVWRDMKNNASKKASKLRNERNRTGNFPVNAEQLDNLEQRVIACMGLEYVQGAVDCPDSTPEEEEYQLQLENGNQDVLRHPPTITSLQEVLHNVASSDNNHHFETYTYNPEEVQEINEDSLSNSDVIPTFENNETNANHCNNKTAESSNQPSKYQQRKQQILQNRKSRQRIGVQLQEAREHFGQIAENHATALQLFAEAALKQAEASLLAARNEEKRIGLEEQCLEIKEKSATSNEQLITVLNNLQKIIEQFYNV